MTGSSDDQSSLFKALVKCSGARNQENSQRLYVELLQSEIWVLLQTTEVPDPGSAEYLALTPEVNRIVLPIFTDEAAVKRFIKDRVMTGAPKPAHEILCLAKQNKDLNIGVHLSLTQAAPVSPLSEVPTLIDQSNNFHKAALVESFPESCEGEKSFPPQLPEVIPSFLSYALSLPAHNG